MEPNNENRLFVPNKNLTVPSHPELIKPVKESPHSEATPENRLGDKPVTMMRVLPGEEEFPMANGVTHMDGVFFISGVFPEDKGATSIVMTVVGQDVKTREHTAFTGKMSIEDALRVIGLIRAVVVKIPLRYR